MKVRPSFAALFATGVGVAVLGLATQAVALHVTPSVVTGNPGCAALMASLLPDEDASEVRELKVDPAFNGTYTSLDGFSVELTLSTNGMDVADDVKGTTAHWKVGPNSPLVAISFAKGGPGGNAYIFDPSGADSHEGEVALTNSNGQPREIDHMLFCYFLGEGELPTLPECDLCDPEEDVIRFELRPVGPGGLLGNPTLCTCGNVGEFAECAETSESTAGISCFNPPRQWSAPTIGFTGFPTPNCVEVVLGGKRTLYCS